MKDLFCRTSVRSYLDQPVEEAKIKKLLEAAMAAPSACNQQPWEFYVVTDQDTLQALSKASPYTGPIGRAPLGIVVCTRKDAELSEYARIDCSAAIENMLIEGVALGLGSVWMGIAPFKERMDNVAKAINMNEELEVFSLVAFGYPRQENEQEKTRYQESRVHYIL